MSATCHGCFRDLNEVPLMWRIGKGVKFDICSDCVKELHDRHDKTKEMLARLNEQKGNA